jgi:hypothetical protein
MFVMVMIFTAVAVVWSITIRRVTVVPLPPGLTAASLGARCVEVAVPITSGNPSDFIPQVCGSNLTCIKRDASDAYGTCLKDLGQPCRTLFECVPAATICSTTCSNS